MVFLFLAIPGITRTLNALHRADMVTRRASQIELNEALATDPRLGDHCRHRKLPGLPGLSAGANRKAHPVFRQA